MHDAKEMAENIAAEKAAPVVEDLKEKATERSDAWMPKEMADTCSNGESKPRL